MYLIQSPLMKPKRQSYLTRQTPLTVNGKMIRKITDTWESHLFLLIVIIFMSSHIRNQKKMMMKRKKKKKASKTKLNNSSNNNNNYSYNNNSPTLPQLMQLASLRKTPMT